MFITFEGIEGCGKTTQIGRFASYLRDKKVPLIQTFEPGGTRIGSEIRRILLDPGNQAMVPLAELCLYAADRAQHVQEVIQPALEKGVWVLCDRFFDATTAYQGMARAQDMEWVNQLNSIVTQGLQPDITFLIDCPVEVGLNRARKRELSSMEQNQDRFEQEALDFHESIRKAYLQIARENQGRFRVIDGTLEEDEVERKILRHIELYLVA